MDNYPDNIRDFDEHPSSPFYVDNSAEILENECVELEELLAKEAHELSLNEKIAQDELLTHFMERLAEQDDIAQVVSQWFNHLRLSNHSNFKSLDKALEEVAQYNIDAREVEPGER